MASLAKKTNNYGLMRLSTFVAEMDAAKIKNADKENYLEDKLWINFEACRVSAGEHANTYIPWLAKTDDGVTIDQKTSFCIDSDEPMRGNIKPLDAWGEEEEKIMFPNQKKVDGKNNLRGDFKPAIQIQKFVCRVEEVNGQVVLPPDDKISLLYRFIEHVKFVFEYTVEKMKNVGADYLKALKSKKKIDCNAFKGKCMMLLVGERNDAIEIEHPEMKPNEIQEFIMQHAVIVKNSTPTKMIQRRTKEGKQMHNPITRFNLGFDPKTGEAKFNAFDTSKSRKMKLPNGSYKAMFQPLNHKGKPHTLKTIHLGIRSGCNIKGSIFKLDTVCASSMGLSVMMPFETLNVKPYIPKPKYDASAACDLGVLDAESVEDADAIETSDASYAPDKTQDYVNEYDEDE